MSGLDDYIYMLKQLGYSVKFVEDQTFKLIVVRLSKNGMSFQQSIPLDDILNLALSLETVKMNVLMSMRKKLDNKLKERDIPRWTDHQVELLTDISDRLVRYGEDQGNESLRIQLRSIAREVKNIIPMEMIKMKGEEK